MGHYNATMWSDALLIQEADKKGREAKKHIFPAKVMVCLGACASGLTKLVIFEKETINHEYYINKNTSNSFKMWK